MGASIDAYARFITSQGRWAGPTVRFPDPVARPQHVGLRLESALSPLVVHAGRAVGMARALAALGALEQAYALALEQGWPLPYPDGGVGGDAGFDLYLVPGLERSAGAHADQPIHWASQDAASTHALVDAGVADAALESCVLSAFVQATLLGLDPAEPAAFRRATAAFLEWRVLGEPGCDASLEAARARPEVGLFADDEESPAATAWLFREVSARHDGGSGRLLLELWQLARQRSAEPELLRASPNLAEALALALANAGESLDRAAEELAVARAEQGSVPMDEAPQFESLPRHLPGHDRPVGLFGSAYTRIDMAGARAGDRLEVWLRGEPGVRWSLIALQRDASGRELGQLSAPARRVPQAFLPVELETGVSEVVLIVTALPAGNGDLQRLQAADAGHHFRLILDRKRAP